MILAVAIVAVLFFLGLQLKCYLDENEERAQDFAEHLRKLRDEQTGEL